MRFRRHYLPWLVVLGIIVGLALLGTAPPASVAMALIALFGAAVALSLVNTRPLRIADRSRSTLAASRMSAAAKEATVLAKRHGSYMNPDVTLMDIGLIATRTTERGIDMRRSRDLSLDDEGVRPYITLNTQGDATERRALIRFEMVDSNGKVRYVHEMRPYLRYGEADILPDHHLPLSENDLAQSGDWDLRVTIDGAMIAVLPFSVAPSLEARYERLQRIQSQGSSSGKQLNLDEQDGPQSLEELLRQQNAQPQTRSRGQ
jgi:hypothetical protein